MIEQRTDDTRKKFSERFKALRQGLAMNQEQFASFLGISRPTIGFYENGTRIPDASTLGLIAKKCNISSDFLLGLSDVSSVSSRGVDRMLGLTGKAVDMLIGNSIYGAVLNRLFSSNEIEQFAKIVIEYNEKTALEFSFPEDEGELFSFYFLGINHEWDFNQAMLGCLHAAFRARSAEDTILDTSAYGDKEPVMQKALAELPENERNAINNVLERVKKYAHKKGPRGWLLGPISESEMKDGEIDHAKETK